MNINPNFISRQEWTKDDWITPKYIIDGYNIIHAVNRYKDELDKKLQNARELLINDLKIYSSIKTVDIIIVFDGEAVTPFPSFQNITNKIKIIY